MVMELGWRVTKSGPSEHRSLHDRHAAAEQAVAAPGNHQCHCRPPIPPTMHLLTVKGDLQT